MRINRIRIGSFGGVKGRDYRIDPGMTVMYGPNESGKTTTMEMIRTVLSPSKDRKKYPVRAKNDDGTIDYEEDGAQKIIRLVGKDVEGQGPACMTNMDPDSYRKIFALDAKTLDDSKSLTEGSVKSRFLTIPGGEGISGAKEDAESREKKILGQRANSSTEFQRMENEISGLETTIASMRAEADTYGALAAQLKQEESKRDAMAEEAEELVRIRSIYEKYRDNQDNFKNLKELRDERDSLGEFVHVTKADIYRRSELESLKKSSQSTLDDSSAEHRRTMDILGGSDRNLIAVRSTAIEKLKSDLSDYLSDRESLERLESVPEPMTVKRVETTRAPSMAHIALGIMLIAIGAIAGVLASLFGFAISVVGALCALYGSMRKISQEVIETQGSARDEAAIAELRRKIDDYENRLRSICSELKVDYGRADISVHDLVHLKQASSEASRTEARFMRAKMEDSKASSDLSEFYSRFSGKEGFDACAFKTHRLNELNLQIGTLEDAIRKSGLDPEKPDCHVHWDESMAVQDTSGEEIGRLRERMKNILDMSELERAMDKLSALKAQRAKLLREGIQAILEQRIIDDACSNAYGEVQPGVVLTAGRYLEPMTCGRYRLDIDPGSNDITVHDADDFKNEAKWSSGLRAQILLSIKLAIAKEMGGGKIPVILDDVLLPFDSEKKKGALKTLLDISSEMQIIMFTCDSETYRIAQELGVPSQPMVRNGRSDLG